MPFPQGWTLQEGSFSVAGAHPVDAVALKRLGRYVDQAVPRIARELGLPVSHRVRLYIASSQDQFLAMQPGRPPRWAEATAWPGSSLVFVKSPRFRPGDASPIEQVLDHEIAHVVLGQAFLPRVPPRWLQEGVAQIVAREYTAETTRALARGLLGRSLLSIEDLAAGFPEEPLRAHLAYAQSADLVAWIRNEYGEDAFQALIRELASGAPVAASFRRATGESLDELDRAWRDRLGSSGLHLTPLFTENLWWFLAAVGLLAGGLGVRRRNRRRREVMAREEAFQDAMEVLARQMRASVPVPPVEAGPVWDNEVGRWRMPAPPDTRTDAEGRLVH